MISVRVKGSMLFSEFSLGSWGGGFTPEIARTRTILKNKRYRSNVQPYKVHINVFQPSTLAIYSQVVAMFVSFLFLVFALI